MAHDSALTGLRMAQVKLIALYSMRFAIRTGGGIVSLLVVGLAALIVASIFIQPVEDLMRTSPEMGHTERSTAEFVAEIAESDAFVDGVEWFTDAGEEESVYLLREQPALLSLIFLVLLMLFPTLTCFSSFNQTSGDIGSRGLRYLLIRTERPNIFFGRFLGTFFFSTISIMGVVLLISLYVGFKLQVYPALEIISWTLQGGLALLVISLPYIALCAWFSCLIDAPFGALAICLLMVLFPVGILKMTNNMVLKGKHDWLELLTPWGWKYDLLSSDIVTRLIACGVMLGFTAVFLALGMRAFAKRDL